MRNFQPEPMDSQVAIIVVDIGKTLSKVTGWTRDGRMLERKVHANDPVVVDGICRLDSQGIAEWLEETLAGLRGHPVEAIVPVAHGAGFAALVDGALAFAPLDNEQAPLPDVLAAYRQQRDPCLHPGSPALPDGLNLGRARAWAWALAAAGQAGVRKCFQSSRPRCGSPWPSRGPRELPR